MRIRKHAARILSSLSIPTQSLASAAAGGRELGMHVCELNQSPWDAMAFTPPESVSFFPYQELEEVEEDSGFAWCGHTEEQDAAAAAAAVSDVSGITAAESTLRRQVKIEVKAEQAAEEEEGEQRKRNRECYSKKRNTSSSNGNITKKTKRKITSSHAAGAADDEKVKVEMQISPPAAAAASTCKKSDGKGWHCKRPAQHPHSLCEYHLNQVRSYYGNGVGTGHAVHHHQQALLKAQDAALVPDNKKKNKKKKTATTTGKKDSCSHGHKSSGGTGGRSRRKPESDFFYYYSGFGPWRGKRRCGGGESDRGDRASSSNVDARDGDDEQRDAAEAAPRDGLPTPTVHDQAPDDLDDDDEDMDGGDHVGGRDGGDDVAAGRRRARKPIKARSLKSLL